MFAAIDIARQYLDDAEIDEDIFHLIESGRTGRKQGENFLRRIKTNEELDKRFHMRGYTFIDKGDPDGLLLCCAVLFVLPIQLEQAAQPLREAGGHGGRRRAGCLSLADRR